jgi:hypothetical protein
MRVTLHVPHHQRQAVISRLVVLAGGDTKAVQSTTSGLTVEDTLARLYLADDGYAPTAGNVRAQRMAASLAAAARDAETQAGLIDDTRAPATGSGARAPRTRKTTTSTPEESRR